MSSSGISRRPIPGDNLQRMDISLHKRLGGIHHFKDPSLYDSYFLHQYSPIILSAINPVLKNNIFSSLGVIRSIEASNICPLESWCHTLARRSREYVISP